MKNEKIFNAIGKVNEQYIEDAKPKINENKNNIWVKWRTIAAAACLVLSISITAYAIEIQRYNAAVDYLTSLGIEATDISDYSRNEIKQAVSVLEAGQTNELTEKILSTAKEQDSTDKTLITKVTSAQIRGLTPYMTYDDIINTLGETQDIGSGIYILVYEVDGMYLLSIPLAGHNEQLGVTGEKLLETLTPKE